LPELLALLELLVVLVLGLFVLFVVGGFIKPEKFWRAK
jgi:hypothetical protein